MCVINPPAFLSEEEARLIIEEELYKENIIFDKKNYKLDDQVFIRKGYYEDKKDTVILDGYSTQYNLGYEFVEADDYLKFGGMTDMSTVQDFDVIEAAENLRIKLKENGKINAVIFYDPMENYERGYEKNEKYEQMKEWNNLEENKEESCRLPGGTSAKEKSIEMLKRQVNDFIEWVKKEGILKDK